MAAALGSMNGQTRQDRFRGCLLGLATGDALGTTLEFHSPGTFEPIDDMVGGGPFELRAGEWTDDTSMALCLAASLTECNGFDARDQMARNLRWFREGYFSATEHCFDIGNTTADALMRFERNGDPMAGSTDPWSAGNGIADAICAGGDVLRPRPGDGGDNSGRKLTHYPWRG